MVTTFIGNLTLTDNETRPPRQYDCSVTYRVIGSNQAGAVEIDRCSDGFPIGFAKIFAVQAFPALVGSVAASLPAVKNVGRPI